jgi:hypothetical protein
MLQVGTRGANHELLQQRERHCKLQEPSTKQTKCLSPTTRISAWTWPGHDVGADTDDDGDGDDVGDDDYDDVDDVSDQWSLEISDQWSLEIIRNHIMNGADTDDDDDDCGLSFIHYVSYKYNQQGESARLLQVQSARRISTRSASINIYKLFLFLFLWGVLVDAQAPNHHHSKNHHSKHHSKMIRTAPLLVCPWCDYLRVLLGSNENRNYPHQGNVGDSTGTLRYPLGPLRCRTWTASCSAGGSPNALGTMVHQLSASATRNAQCRTSILRNQEQHGTEDERTKDEPAIHQRWVAHDQHDQWKKMWERDQHYHFHAEHHQRKKLLADHQQRTEILSSKEHWKGAMLS